MKLEGKECTDGEIFRCSSRQCRKTKSVRDGSFFSKSKLSLEEQVLLIHLFAKRYPESLILDDFEFSPNTVCDWMRYGREICVDRIESLADEQIGGPNCTVEIDESVIVRRKYECGRVLSTQWMFGAVERREGGYGSCFIELVDDRSQETLIEIICRRIHPESRIVSDGWRAYRNLQEYGFAHDIVIHERNFVEPR